MPLTDVELEHLFHGYSPYQEHFSRLYQIHPSEEELPPFCEIHERKQ